MKRRKRVFNSLCEWRDEKAREKKEKIISFDGYSLTTNKGVYTMDFDGILLNGKHI